MPRQKTKFSEAWLNTVDSNDDQVSQWCRKRKDEYHGYCFFCNADIKCDNGGKVQLLKHCTQKKHKDAMKHAKNNKEAIWLYAELFWGHHDGSCHALW